MITTAVQQVGRKSTAEISRAAVASPETLIKAKGGDNHEERLYSMSSDYLGGQRFWQQINSRSDVHSTIMSGVAYASLIYLIDEIKVLDLDDVVKALGISTRTLRRQSENPDKQMPTDLASKAWLFAETLAKATEIVGSKEEAEGWMSKPAMGLDGQRPIDMLQTVQGAELVSDFLTRLEYGVYS